MNKTFDDSIQVTPIYIDIYSSYHLDNYLQRRQEKIVLEKKIIDVPILPPPPALPIEQPTGFYTLKFI